MPRRRLLLSLTLALAIATSVVAGGRLAEPQTPPTPPSPPSDRPAPPAPPAPPPSVAQPAPPAAAPGPPPAVAPAVRPSPPRNPMNAAHLAAIREQIKGRENEPAPNVFKNIQLENMKNATADRLLRVMEMGYSRSLGVGCDHCHTPGKWEDDGKEPKQIAREMNRMVGRINGELLGNIAALKERKPVVNCTTCHRGDVKPALNL